MRKIYKIIGQDFSETNSPGVMLRIKNLYSGEVLFRTPLQIFRDKPLLKRLHVSDILRIGYMVGEEHMYLSYKYMKHPQQEIAH